MTNTFTLRTLIWIAFARIIIIISFSLHPITIIILIIFYNILICINISFWKQTYLYSLLFFLIIISGLLIIFLYFSRLISNEKSQNFNKKFFIITALTLPFIIINFPYPPNLTNISHFTWTFMLTTPLKFPWILYKETIPFIYLYPMLNLTLIRMNFLLITLLSIIKISTPKIKSLRKIIL